MRGAATGALAADLFGEMEAAHSALFTVRIAQLCHRKFQPNRCTQHRALIEARKIRINAGSARTTAMKRIASASDI